MIADKANPSRFLLKRGETWHRGARVTKRAPAPKKQQRRKRR